MITFKLDGPGGIPGLKMRPTAISMDTTAPWTFPGNVTINGTLTTVGTGMDGAQVITAANANALAVGANGTTNPTFNVDTSAASVATGINIKGAAAGSGVAVSVLTSGTNENITLDAAGSGTIALAGTSTGAVTVGHGLAVTGTITGTNATATALTVGPNGTTNPTLTVDSHVASAATGIKIVASAAGNGVDIVATSSGTNEPLQLDGKGSGAIQLGTNSTGIIVVARGSHSALVNNLTTTSIATQNSTPTAAQMLGGIINHASTTGPGTATLPSGTSITGAIANAAVGDSFTCVYANSGTQTVTITTNTGLTLYGTVAIPSGKNALLIFTLLGSNTAAVYIEVSA